MQTVTAPQRPALRWVGNKQGTPIIDRVAELYASYRQSHIWAEPFVGIGGALLTINPDRAICSDASSEVIGLHRWIQDGAVQIEFDREWNKEDFFARRDRFLELQKHLLFENRAEFYSLMLWLNRACFNGLWRVNQKGEFNTPPGKKSDGTPNRFDTAVLPKYKQSWTFCQGGFSEVRLISDCFIYVDPPYWGTHSAYTKDGFKWADQVALAEMLARSEMPCAASNSSSPEIVALYTDLGFAIELIPVRRSISCKGSKRPPAVEMLAIKNC